MGPPTLADSLQAGTAWDDTKMEGPSVCPPAFWLYKALLCPLALPTFLPLPLHPFFGQLTYKLHSSVPSSVRALLLIVRACTLSTVLYGNGDRS